MTLVTQQVKHLEAEFHAAKLPTNPSIDWSDDTYDRPYQKHEVTPPPPPPPNADLGPDAEPPARVCLTTLHAPATVQPRGGPCAACGGFEHFCCWRHQQVHSFES